MLELNRKNMKKLMGLVAFAILLNAGLQNTRLVAGALRHIVGLFAPFLTGGCLAFILNVPMGFFERKLFSSKGAGSRGGKRAISLMLTLLAVLGVIGVVLFMVVPGLYQSFSAIGRELAQARVRIPQLLDELAGILPMFSRELAALKDSFLHVDWQAAASMAVEFLRSSNALGRTVDMAASLASGITTAVIGLVFAIYILLQKEGLGRQFRRLFYAFLPEKPVSRFLEVCELTSSAFHSFLSGQCVEAVILGLMFFIGMTVFRIPYALVVAVLIGVTALIPVFGAVIGCIIGTLLILMAEPIKALWFVILFVVLQQIEGNIIYPRVVGSSVGLPSIWVLAAVTLGAGVAGMAGLLFAIPVCSVVYTLLRRAVRLRMDGRDADN